MAPLDLDLTDPLRTFELRARLTVDGRLELIEGFPIVVSLFQDCLPAQPRLRRFEHQEFEVLAKSNGIKVFPKAVELVEAIRSRGIKTVLATSSGKKHLEAIAKASGVDFREKITVTRNHAGIIHHLRQITDSWMGEKPLDLVDAKGSPCRFNAS